MQSVRALMAAAIASAALLPGFVAAHSLDSLQQDVFDKEKYFEVRDEPAPEWNLQDADGNPFSSQDLRGKAVVMHFIYAGCPDACPLHAEKIGEVQRLVNETDFKDKVQLITVTTDPERDVPESLKAYGPAHGLDPETNWVFLTSGPDRPEDTTRRLAEQFGHSFTVTEDGAQVHSVVTHVVDTNGRWVANFHGLGFESENLVSFLDGLVNDLGEAGEEHHRSVWQRIQSLF